VKGWGPLSRHGTAEGGRSHARLTSRMPRPHSRRPPGRMSEFTAGEPAGPTEQPARPAEQRVQPAEQPAQAIQKPVQATQKPVPAPELLAQLPQLSAQIPELSEGPAGPAEQPVRPAEQPVRPSKLLVLPSKLLRQPLELQRLFTTFSFLVAKQGATAVLGLAYWAVATHLFSARDVGLAAAASSTALFLAAIGALGIPLLLLAELESVPAAVRRVTFSTGISIACSTVLILSLATLALSPFLGASLRIIGADSATSALFVIGSVATIGGLTFDNAAIGLHRGSAQLTRGSLTSTLKLAIVGVLVLAGIRTAPGLLFAWALAKGRKGRLKKKNKK